jgi:hypothetical protein
VQVHPALASSQVCIVMLCVPRRAPAPAELAEALLALPVPLRR